MASLRISQLAELLASDVSSNDLLAIVDQSASETKNVQIESLAKSLGPLFPDGSIPGSKVVLEVPDGSIGTAALANQSVTAEKLAGSSSGLYGPRPISGSHVGQICAEDNLLYMWDGGQWKGIDGPNSIIRIAYGGGPVELISIDSGNGTATITTGFADSTAPRQFVAGPTAAAGDVVLRQIVGADLPIASTSEPGAVQVAGNGLTMNGNTIGISNVVEPSDGAFYVVDYDANGLIVNSRQIEAQDLPLATDSTVGVVRSGTGLTVSDQGDLNHLHSVIPGTYPKVEIDSEGHIIAGTSLSVDDIPILPASQISGGVLDPTLISNQSIGAAKLDDYSTCYIQPDQPGTGEFLGQFWLNPTTNQLFAYARGSNSDYWIGVGFGRLQQENLRICGTFDAEKSTILTLTSYGTQAGLSLGPIPEATEELTGVYLVCQNPGNQIKLNNLQGVACTAGDWILALAEAWEHVNVGTGSGGGGGAVVLNDLLDVELESTGRKLDLQTNVKTLEDKNILVYEGSSGLWKNRAVDALGVPVKTSDLENDGEGSGKFITAAEAPVQPDDIPELVQSDWEESDVSNPAYIQNKPTIEPGGVTSIVAGDNITISPTNGLGDVTITAEAESLEADPGKGINISGENKIGIGDDWSNIPTLS